MLTYSTFVEDAMVVKKNVIRGGQAIRRKAFSTKTGYGIRGGKAYRMTPEFRRMLSIIQKRAAKKRKLKMSQTLRKRAKSMRKRKILGFAK